MSQFNYFFLNSHKYASNKKLTLLEIVQYFNYSASLFVLEHNQIICAKVNWHRIYVNDNDKIEIVTIVGGG